MDDAELLKTVRKEQLVTLCEQFSLSTRGTKDTLLQRLRSHAEEQAKRERQRYLKRLERVEEGSDNSKERYEIVSDDPEDDDLDEGEGFFYFEAPGIEPSEKKPVERKPQKPTTIPGSAVTAPPPPDEPNEDGERVVTVYSTQDQNDLTGIAAAQPGATNAEPSLSNVLGSNYEQQKPWDRQQATQQITSQELDDAKEKIAELVQALLSDTGLPAFSADAVDGEHPNSGARASPQGSFVGFNPGSVPTELLAAASQALRADRGRALQDVLRQFEMQAIGYDGIKGDDVERGGGHYREVAKVRAFLEGYRRAEVRKLSRETASLLLDKLVSEGVQGLDFALASMTRTSDDTGGHAGELNDSLLDYLNDAIRQQQKKVDQLVADRPEQQSNSEAMEVDEGGDRLERLWNVTTEDGQRVETLDPNDPRVQRVLKEEYSKALASPVQKPNLPNTAPEQLLLLLTLLRERIKAEAAFAPDEKGRNLRLLAYCLQVSTEEEREQLILKDVGTSMDVSAKYLAVESG
jgi:hypothetical protein